MVLYKTNLYRVIGAGIGGAAGGRLLIQRKDERGLKLGRLVWAAEVQNAEPASLRASTSGEAPRRSHHRLAALDQQDQRTSAHAPVAHREGRAARAGR